MPVLKYHDGTAWVEVSTAGPQGPPGPSGATGPTGVGVEEVVVSNDGIPPTGPGLELWVDRTTVGTGMDEVTVSATLPTAPTLDLWVDTSVATPVMNSVQVLDDLADVDTATTAPADGDSLTWSTAGSQWLPTAPPPTGVPTGTIVMFGAAVAPAGWHICDGSAHGSAELEAVIGSSNAPDLRSKFIAGAGSDYVVGMTGGSNAVTLTVAEMPGHTHQQTFYDALLGAAGGSNGIMTGSSLPGALPADQYTLTTGGNTPHENRPPFFALTFIVKK